MATMATPPATAFTVLPIEINQLIATNLEDDQDIGRYRMICRNTLDSVDADSFSFWRRRFLAVFESPSWALTGERMRDNEKFRAQYQKRKAMFSNVLARNDGRGFGFLVNRGTRKAEKACLEILRDMIIEAYADKTEVGATYESSNMKILLRFVEDSDILKCIGHHTPSGKRRARPSGPVAPSTALMNTVQCLLAPQLFSLESTATNTDNGFAEAQQIAYGTNISDPIFTGCNNMDVNMPWVLANIQFWRHHMLRKDEGILHKGYTELDPSERPQWFTNQLTHEMSALGSEWKGCYAFVDRDMIKRVRNGYGLNNHVIDEMNGESSGDFFQNLGLELLEPGKAPWPNLFEKHLKSITPTTSSAKTRAQKSHASPDTIKDKLPQSFRFEGEGRDVDEDFCASGWLNPLPKQNGVPGWQRMTMMKYFIDEHGVVDVEALWAYEGVLLPGGKIMLGRWWCPSDGEDDDMYSGPFILWNTPSEEAGNSEVGIDELMAAPDEIQYE